VVFDTADCFLMIATLVEDQTYRMLNKDSNRVEERKTVLPKKDSFSEEVSDNLSHRTQSLSDFTGSRR
jgi:hypothetical protein